MDDHVHKLICKTIQSQIKKDKCILVGVATCMYCPFEVDCPVKEHKHG